MSFAQYSFIKPVSSALFPTFPRTRPFLACMRPSLRTVDSSHRILLSPQIHVSCKMLMPLHCRPSSREGRPWRSWVRPRTRALLAPRRVSTTWILIVASDCEGHASKIVSVNEQRSSFDPNTVDYAQSTIHTQAKSTVRCKDTQGRDVEVLQCP